MTRSKLGRIYPITFAALMTLAAVPPLARGAGEDSPASPSGVFNGNVTTAGDYDPYTGNVKRVVDDMVVPGCVGAYPLKLTRYYNSRAANTIKGPRQWVNSYEWEAGAGVVYYPDGRAGNADDGTWAAPGDTWDNATVTLTQSDGGQVHFFLYAGSLYLADQVIDPYGQVTTIEHTGTFVSKVIEPGGRYLKFNYMTEPDGTVDLQSVQAFAAAGGAMTDSVTYKYIAVPVAHRAGDPYEISHVDYSDGTSADYFYEDDNAAWDGLNPTPRYPNLLKCIDVRQRGSMRAIAYDYTQSIADNNWVHGSVKAEKNPYTGELISKIAYTTANKDRTETRGDGPTRDFHYNGTSTTTPGLLTSYTDFLGKTTQLGYPQGSVFFTSVQDARGNTTTYNRNKIGIITKVIHPAPDNTFATYAYDAATGHYMMSKTDERGNTTTFRRDAKNRIKSIDYPADDNNVIAHESFVYNSFGQVTRHQRRNGAYEHFAYDTRGLLTDKWNPTLNAAPGAGDAKTHYDYYTSGPWTDRVMKETKPANASGFVTTETYEYDLNFGSGAPCAGCGLVTKITHADGTSKAFGYDAWGNKLWEQTEYGPSQRTSYSYDGYSRLTSVSDPLGHTTSYFYDNVHGGAESATSHTTNSPGTIKDPAGVITTNVYDENFRRTSSAVASNPPTRFHHDEVGNEDQVTDPRGHTTKTTYDERDRKETITAAFGDPVLAQTTIFGYDECSNVTSIKRPDQKTETKAYDNLNRLSAHTEPVKVGLNKTTQFDYTAAGMLWHVTDPNGHPTTFSYNEADLKIKMAYLDNSAEQWDYDDVYNLQTRTTVNNEVQSFGYDGRNRQQTMTWSNVAEWAFFGYDNASRLTYASNGTGAWGANTISVVTRTYDAAGRLKTDKQAVTAGISPSITVQYGYDGAATGTTDNGRLTGVNVGGTFNPNTGYFTGGGYDKRLRYDTMGRLEYIGDQFNRLNNGTGDYIRYWYDADSNIVERDTMLNSSSIATPYDALHRMGSRTAKVGAAIMSKETYGYDNDMNWLVSIDRTEDNKRDSFGYDFSGQMTSANYGGTIPSATPTPTPTPAPGQVQPITFGYSGGYPDALLVTMSSATAGATIFYTEEDNGYVNPTHSGGSATGTHTTPYSGPVRLAINQEKFFSALGYKSGMTDSGITQRFVSNAGTTGPTIGPNTPATTPHSVSYILDKAGNRTNVTDAGVSTPYTPNVLNQYGSAGTPVTNGSEHEITNYANVTYSYINDGRLKQATSGTFIYQMFYDALGRCVRRILNGSSTFYYYDGEKPIIEQSGTVAAPVSNSNIYGIGPDEIVVRFEAVNAYFFYQDHEGSITHVRNNAGLVEQYRYDAFGAPTIRNAGGTTLGNSQIGNRFMYTGREWAKYFGFYEYRARAYHPGLGRFMSEDPKGFDAGDYNLFRYCHNDPEDRTDPMGMEDFARTQGQVTGPDAVQGPQNSNPIEERLVSQQTSIKGEMAAHSVEAAAQPKTASSNINSPNFLQRMSARLERFLNDPRVQDAAMMAIPEAKGLKIAEEGAAAIKGAPKIGKIVDTILQWLGKERSPVITNKAGDKIFMDAAQTKKLRFDINNPKGDAPHLHIEERLPGEQRWRDATDTHRYYFEPDGG